MDFYDIISRCGPDTIEKRRVFEPTFAELLIRNEHVDTWHNGCRAFLGEPVKPADTPASDHTTAISKDYGGARSGQTLYAHEAYGMRMVVIFWPWAKGPYTTVRLGLTDLSSEQATKVQPLSPSVTVRQTTTPESGSGTHTQVVSIGSHFSRGIGMKPKSDDSIPHRIASLERSSN
jgi:hypothetical protein